MEIRINLARILRSPSVDKHRIPIAKYQSGIALPDIEIVYFKSIHGFADFLETINPDHDEFEDPDEIAEMKQQKKEYLDWAKGMGWKRKENASNFNLL